MEKDIKEKSFSKGKLTYGLKKEKVSIEALLPFLQKEEVNELCKACPNYKNNWSCPPKTPSFENFTKRFTKAEVLLFWCETKQFKKEKDASTACYEFLKKESRKYVLKREEKKGGKAIMSFSCDLCSSCKLKKGKPCSKPKEMRFNLTAFGFQIDTLASQLMNHPLSWDKDEKKAKYITQVALVIVA